MSIIEFSLKMIKCKRWKTHKPYKDIYKLAQAREKKSEDLGNINAPKVRIIEFSLEIIRLKKVEESQTM